MKVYIWLSILLVGGLGSLDSQSLADYLALGLNNNRQLRVAQSSKEVSQRALEEANLGKTLRLDFNPTYTLAFGGRVIDLPVGDLLNPVYGTLNQLTASEQFPQIENVSELLNPNNFYDVKVRATYPIINQAIGVNQDIKMLEVEIAGYEIERNRQQLAADIAAAYYDYQMARRAQDIYLEAMLLVNESIRVNRGLLARGAALPIAVRSAENDSIQLAKEIANAKLAATQAAAYLNFLADQPLDQPVAAEEPAGDLPLIPLVEPNSLRPELAQLATLSQLNARLGDLADAQSGPQFNAFADAGLQGFDFAIDGQAPYVFAGLSFNINLYDGGQAKAKKALALARQNEANTRREAIARQIELEIFNTRQKLDKRFNDYAALEREVTIRNQQYKNQLKRYRAGTVNYIAVQDARNDLVQARLKRNISRYQAWKEVAEYRRALGLPVK